MQKKNIFLLMVASLLFISFNSYAEMGSGAFNADVTDIRGLGKGHTSTATADRPSAIAGNPAGLTQLKGTYLTSMATIINLRTSYEDTNNNVSEDMKNEYHPVPSMYATTDLGTDRYRFGIGITSPYGLITNWPREGFSRYVAQKTCLRVISVNPTFAMKICDMLSIGVGYVFIKSKIIRKKMMNVNQLNRKIDPDSPSVDDAFINIDADGDGHGYNFGILFTPNEQHSFGGTFRSQVGIEFDGMFTISGLEGISSLVFGSGYYQTKTKSKLTLPPTIGLGYAFKPTPKWVFEVNVQWTGWDKIQQDYLEFTDEPRGTIMDILNTGNPVRKEWENTVSVGTGVEYKINDMYAIRSGYYYLPTPVPDNSFSPELPDSDRHYVTAGFGIVKGNWMFDWAYSIGFFEDRTIENNVGEPSGISVDGEYKTIVQAIGLGEITYKFN